MSAVSTASTQQHNIPSRFFFANNNSTHETTSHAHDMPVAPSHINKRFTLEEQVPHLLYDRFPHRARLLTSVCVRLLLAQNTFHKTTSCLNVFCAVVVGSSVRARKNVTQYNYTMILNQNSSSKRSTQKGPRNHGPPGGFLSADHSSSFLSCNTVPRGSAQTREKFGF